TLREPPEPPLRGGIHRTRRSGILARETPDENQRSLRFAEMGKSRSRSEEGTIDVDVHHRPIVRRFEVLDRGPAFETGIVDEHVTAAERLDRALYEILDRFLVGDVGG